MESIHICDHIASLLGAHKHNVHSCAANSHQVAVHKVQPDGINSMKGMCLDVC